MTKDQSANEPGRLDEHAGGGRSLIVSTQPVFIHTVPVFSGEPRGREVLTYDFLTHFLPFHSTLSLCVFHTVHTNSCLRKLSESHKFRLTVKLRKFHTAKTSRGSVY